MKSFIITFVLVFASLGLSGKNMSIELTENPESVKNSILNIIPIGSDINAAKIIMEKNGFKCSIQKDSSFTDGEKVYEHIDFLYCDIEKGFLIGRRWQVAIVFKKNSVTEILVSTGLTGP